MQPEATDITIPLSAEEISIGKVTSATERVRVTTHVTTQELEVAAARTTETLEIERVPIDREVTGPLEIRVEGDTTIVPVVEETIVLQKRYVLREEVRITKRRSEQVERLHVPVRRETAEITRSAAAGDDPERRSP